MSKFNSNGNCKFNVSYHIVWIPKYRKHIIDNKIELRLIELLYDKASHLNIQIGALECMSDHIHLFIRSNTTYNISFIVKMLKGYSSYMLRKEFIQLRKYKNLWASGYFCETIGNISESSILRYINNQKSN